MHLLLLAPASLLGLGKPPSASGQSLALIITFFVILGGLANVLIAYAIGQVFVERRQNLRRQREYDARHPRA